GSASAGSVDVEASSGGAGFSSEGISGAAADFSVAGSLGLTIANVTTTATLAGQLTNAAADSTFQATSATTSSATATAGSGAGIGASAAVDIVTDTTRASLGDGSVFNGHNLTLQATGTDAMTLTSKTGAASGSVAIVPSVAVALSTVTTDASIGT